MERYTPKCVKILFSVAGRDDDEIKPNVINAVESVKVVKAEGGPGKFIFLKANPL